MPERMINYELQILDRGIGFADDTAAVSDGLCGQRPQNDHFAAQLPKFPVIGSAKPVAIRNPIKRKRIPTAFGLGMTRMRAACLAAPGAWQERTERAPGSNDTRRTGHELGAAARRRTLLSYDTVTLFRMALMAFFSSRDTCA